MNETDDVCVDDMEYLDSRTAQLTYNLLGRQHEKLMELTEEYEKRGLEHLESYKQLQDRAARFREMRGILQNTADENLRSGTTGGDRSDE